MGASSSSGADNPGSQSKRVHYDNTGSLTDPKIYNEIVFGDSEDITFGLYNEICVGSYLDLTIGMLLEVVVGPMAEFCGGGLFEMTGLPFGILRTWTEGFESEHASSLPLAAQYDLVSGSYYELIKNGSMYYWEPGLEDDDPDDAGTFTVKNDAYESTPAAKLDLPQSYAEVVGAKYITAVNSISCVVPAPKYNITIAAENVLFRASGAMAITTSELLQAQGGSQLRLGGAGGFSLSGGGGGFALANGMCFVGSAGPITLPAMLIELGQDPTAQPEAAELAEQIEAMEAAEAAAAAAAAAEAAEAAAAEAAAARMGVAPEDVVD